MYINKNFTPVQIMKFSGGHLIWISIWAIFVSSFSYFSGFKFIHIPFLPLSLIGTAVAFYIGFKNNQAYDRLWEARKIWGAIINSSRSWGINIRSFVGTQFTNQEYSEDELKSIHKRIIYRHIAWLYTLRNQLLIPTPWEHINQGKHVGNLTAKRMKTMGVGLFSDTLTEVELKKHLSDEEYEELIEYKNTATQIIDKQSQDLQKLRSLDLINDFRHIELQKNLQDFLDHQGKCERIKKFPLPRQYGSVSFIFVGIFIFLLPFGMISEFTKLGPNAVWLSIPFTIIVSWVYIMMELVGDYSENPFEGLGNDIPTLSLTRVIEIDLKEMLKENEIPSSIEAIDGVLM